MKTCKIILIVLYILDIIWGLIKTGLVDSDEQLTQLVSTIISAVVYGILLVALESLIFNYISL